MSRRKFKNRREVTKFYSPSGEEVTFGDELIITKKKMTPYGMCVVFSSVTLTKDNVQDLISKGIVVQKREKKEWEPTATLQITISKVIGSALDAHEYYFPFIYLLNLIKKEMYGTDSNEGCEYGVNLTGAIGKFTAPVALGYPLFKSPEDVQKAIRPINILYKKMYTD